jgi:hypothetical protein
MLGFESQSEDLLCDVFMELHIIISSTMYNMTVMTHIHLTFSLFFLPTPCQQTNTHTTKTHDRIVLCCFSTSNNSCNCSTYHYTWELLTNGFHGQVWSLLSRRLRCQVGVRNRKAQQDSWESNLTSFASEIGRHIQAVPLPTA